MDPTDKEEIESLAAQPVEGVVRKKKKKKKKAGSSRGIETLFRSTYRVHVEVSALADSKANFLISVNSIIVLLTVAHGQAYVTHNLLLFPAALIFVSSICSMICAVLVARPRMSKGCDMSDNSNQTIEDTNLLFFGSFAQLSDKDFLDGFMELVEKPETIYPAMASDIYGMGQVLQKKFRRLQVAYGFLLWGLPAGVVLFAVLKTLILTKVIV